MMYTEYTEYIEAGRSIRFERIAGIMISQSSETFSLTACIGNGREVDLVFPLQDLMDLRDLIVIPQGGE